MIRPHSYDFRTTVLYCFTIQLLLYSTVTSGSNYTATSTPSGAEFLKKVIGNLHRPNRKVYSDRIDVVEYNPSEIPFTGPASDELKILSKLPNNFNGQFNQKNSPIQVDVKNNNKAESIFSQFYNGEFAESQNKIVSQGPPPQQFNIVPNNPTQQNIIDAISDGSIKPDGSIAGYNYVFYPLDSQALQQLQSQHGNGLQQPQMQNDDNQQGTEMDPGQSENQMTKPKVEPLFVAMAGFVGVAVIFLSALMFIPRFPVTMLHSKAVLKRAPEELASLTRLVAESIDGKDCSERIACEVGRAMRSMQVSNKPIRMMEIILPPAVAKQLAQIRRSATKKEQCHFIMCKKTEGTIKLVSKLKKPNHTIHDVKQIFNI